jgi:hypothetical protein
MIKDLKDLQSLLKLCRKQGVTEIDVQGLKVRFGDLPIKRDGQEQDDTPDPDMELTPEQLMYFSAGGMPPP